MEEAEADGRCSLAAAGGHVTGVDQSAPATPSIAPAADESLWRQNQLGCNDF